MALVSTVHSCLMIGIGVGYVLGVDVDVDICVGVDISVGGYVADDEVDVGVDVDGGADFDAEVYVGFIRTLSAEIHLCTSYIPERLLVRRHCRLHLGPHLGL